jgi:hypothetical protein
MRVILTAILMTLALGGEASFAQNASSPNHRLLAAAPASVAARAQSPISRLAIAGGSGVPVGISASTNTSANNGQQSTQLPTDNVFASGLEGG